jgi:hypothetical protein
MKILLLVQQNDQFIEFVNKFTSNENLVIKTASEFSPGQEKTFDAIYVYPGKLGNEISNEMLLDTVDHKLFKVVAKNKNAFFLIEHHYSYIYSNFKLRFRIVTKASMTSPFTILSMLHKYPSVEKNFITERDTNFILTVGNKIICFVSSTCTDNDVLNAMPVINTSSDAVSNINMQTFFNSKCVSAEQIKLRGNKFWDHNFHYIWGEYYDYIQR